MQANLPEFNDNAPPRLGADPPGPSPAARFGQDVEADPAVVA